VEEGDGTGADVSSLLLQSTNIPIIKVIISRPTINFPTPKSDSGGFGFGLGSDIGSIFSGSLLILIFGIVNCGTDAK
jgi:hypothetical protein